MNLIQKFRAKTPRKNKVIGRWLTVVCGAITATEVVLHTYQVDVPKWLRALFILSAIITAVSASWHGAQVKGVEE